MPGANCAFPGCGTSRRKHYAGISIFRVAQRQSSDFVAWRAAVVNVIKKYREVDDNFKRQIASGNIYTCERHYKLEDIEFTKTGKKVLSFGAVPTVNLPEKSHQSKVASERKHQSIVKDIPVKQKEPCYKSFKELCLRIKKLKINQWQIQYQENTVSLKLFDEPHLISKFEIIVEENLSFTCAVFGWLLPINHQIYSELDRSLQNITVSELLQKIQCLKLCLGSTIKDDALIDHSIPCKLSLEEGNRSPFQNVRSPREGAVKCKEFLKPFVSCEDDRFDWLEHEFLGYLEGWKKVIDDRSDCSSSARSKMLISHPTYEGLQITTYSVIEATKFLLQQGLQFVLTNRFNQDVVEEYFGRQRCLGRRSDNPTLWTFGFNDNTIRMQRSVVPVTGNTKGGHTQKRQVSWSDVDNTDLKKRKAKRK